MMCFQNVTLSLGLFNEAKHYLGKVKTKPMKWFCLAWDIRGSPRSFAGALTCALVQAAFHLLASFPSLPPILWGKYTFKTNGFSQRSVDRCLGDGLWLSCHNYHLAAEESAAFSLATFIALQ